LNKLQHQINYTSYADITELSENDAKLLDTARKYTTNAYAPYSNFNVAASALMQDGDIISGTNQENASYPVGICAERTLLSTIANIKPNAIIETMAISYFNKNNAINDKPAMPCGMCRQALSEAIQRQAKPIRLIVSRQSGAIIIFENALDLLPFSFENSFLQ
jgi:cytidine deaminase